ncbi:hypothetical protein G7B40_001350 [Aetokthonos hydrillicola Thurmond2011]|jgi:hypothetical protein|uniref:Uncharacterized protein n=1 Tax=Aetokthonos hydrillicola Thurmond2011 TaxID=2712845 RepID=A0AAP5I1T2_9CYAN|nr:hypothetical protein [Aetokthonos hydrillicola]MBO3463822.1 hypothetical protein [Aetokthonos hydrillicola CCALA 1050]MDR9893231.1 hypothetical protein [Aetokthonos hydrillicola Thurmond2011]
MTETNQETKTITYTEKQWIWRVQGDFVNGDINSLNLVAFWETVWIDSNGEIINKIPGGQVNITATPDILDSLKAVQAHINEVISQTQTTNILTN